VATGVGSTESSKKTVKAPKLGGSGTVTLDEAVFAVEIKPHLVHEAVRSEMNAQRAGTVATKSRGLVSGGRAKPWRQKGTGRARQGTIRAPQFKGGGHTFAKVPRTFIQKVNRKAHKAALRSALASHAQEGTLAVIDGSQFDAPSTKKARAIVEAWGQQSPTVLVCLQEEQNLSKSFRNLERVAVIGPSEVEVGAVVWARSLLVSEAALPLVQGKAQ
jgi:large subunit ribosomal protein L4